MPATLAYRATAAPLVTVVVPSADGLRGGNVPRLLEQLRAQSVTSLEVILSIGESPNGHARNVGIKLASQSSRYFAFFDDDVELGDDRVVEKLIAHLDVRQIGLVGASQLPPTSSSLLQRWIGYDLGKAKFPVQQQLVDTEMATHAGMACRREVWEEMGGESDTLVTGTDTDLRERLRAAGYRVVVAAKTWVFHPLPTSVGQVLRGAIRNGWHQLDYRRVHGFQSGVLGPFRAIRSPAELAFVLAREVAIVVPSIFVARRRIAIGFRPLNAAFRFLMVTSYSLRAYRERNGRPS